MSSSIAYEGFREAEQKFDYFVAGLAGAMFAYSAQSYVPVEFGINSNTIEAISLALLAIAFFLGLKRIEMVTVTKRLNYEALIADETAGKMTKAIAEAGGQEHGFQPGSGRIIRTEDLPALRIEKLRESKIAHETLNRVSRSAKRFYKGRNLFLAGGFLALLASKLLSPYI